MNATADLPDLNVGLALASPTHQHHSSAVRYWEKQSSQHVLFCTVTAPGLVRLVSFDRDSTAAALITAFELATMAA